MVDSADNVTRPLDRWHEGDRAVLERLLPMVHADLRRMAASVLHARFGDSTLQTTALANADKRVGSWQRDDFTAALELLIHAGADLNALDQALTELESFDERMARAVELRYFVGLDTAEVVGLPGITERTAQRDRVGARAWLKERLDGRSPSKRPAIAWPHANAARS